jgi:hypothetical protein
LSRIVLEEEVCHKSNGGSLKKENLIMVVVWAKGPKIAMI